MRIHFSLIAGISGNKGNESAASYGLIHQELIEASLVSSADRVGVVVECADLCAFKCSYDTFFFFKKSVQVALTLQRVSKSGPGENAA